jgi:hypothetical protein
LHQTTTERQILVGCDPDFNSFRREVEIPRIECVKIGLTEPVVCWQYGVQLCIQIGQLGSHVSDMVGYFDPRLFVGDVEQSFNTIINPGSELGPLFV